MTWVTCSSLGLEFQISEEVRNSDSKTGTLNFNFPTSHFLRILLEITDKLISLSNSNKDAFVSLPSRTFCQPLCKKSFKAFYKVLSTQSLLSPLIVLTSVVTLERSHSFLHTNSLTKS